MKKFNKELAIGLNTFIRDENLKRFVASCQTFYPELKIYIIEQGRIEEPKKKFYEYLQDEGHVIHQIPFDSGISYAREELRKIVEEPYLMYMQDDFIVVYETKIYNMLHVLKSDKKLGVVCGGLISCRKEIDPIPTNPIIHGHFLNKCDNTLLYMPIDYLFKLNLLNWRKTKCKGLRYVYCDISWDFSIWDLKAQENLFDSNVHVQEHSHVYLNIKKENKYRVAYTPESVIVHTHDRSDKEYEGFRKRQDIDYLLEYWKIKDMVNMSQGGRLPSKEKILKTSIELDIPERPSDLKQEEPPMLTTDKNIEIIPEIPIVKTPSQIDFILKEFVNCFRNLNKDIYLSKDTCLQGVVNHNLNGSVIYLSTSKLKNSEKEYLINAGFIYSEQDEAYTKNNCKIILDYQIPREEKNITIFEQAYKVPFPVHKYLQKIYGKTWKDIGLKMKELK